MGTRSGRALSADNTQPDRFTLIETLRRAAPTLPFGPSVIATIDALLSCLPPKRNHNLVFASNATLVMRRNGISDRTLRRHLADLVEAGMLLRIDSPNGKRYSKRDPENGSVLRFGLDLSPLFASFERLQRLAKEQACLATRTAYLRTKLRVSIHRGEAAGSVCATLSDARRALRRKLTIAELEGWLELVPQAAKAEMDNHHESDPKLPEMSASNGQNVRHHQKSEKELIEGNAGSSQYTASEPANAITLHSLAEACPQAADLLPVEMQSNRDVMAHAKRLAPMIGIDDASYQAAEARHGPFGAALTVWGMLEMLDGIAQPGAYFRSLTSGSRAANFHPLVLIDRLISRARRKSQSCPRTIPLLGRHV